MKKCLLKEVVFTEKSSFMLNFPWSTVELVLDTCYVKIPTQEFFHMISTQPQIKTLVIMNTLFSLESYPGYE